MPLLFHSDLLRSPPPNHPGIAEQYVTKGFREEHLMGLEGQRKQSGEMAPFS